MKKSILLVTSLAIMSLSTISCDTNDDSSCTNTITGELSETEADFVGVWVIKSIVAEDEIDLTDDDVENPSMDILNQYTACQQDIIYEFKNDRSFSFKQGTSEATCSFNQTLNGSWKLEAGSLTFVSNCILQSTDIDINDTKTEFSLEYDYDFIDVEQNTITTKVVFTYEKTNT